MNSVDHLIPFHFGMKNKLYLNPRLSDQEKQIFYELQQEFEIKFPKNNFVFIASSGSSKSFNESPKLVAIHINSLNNSAQRFNHFFNVGPDDHWGLVLPTFHIAGLAVLQRAHLAGSKVYEWAWDIGNTVEQIEKHQIKLISLVPTQVFDLVQSKKLAPSCLKKVFVGAGSLNFSVRDSFLNLNWPLVETYGMTETCSMIAIKDNPINNDPINYDLNEYYKLLPGISVKLNDQMLNIASSSLAFAVLQIKNSSINIQLIEDHFQTEDLFEVNENKIKFLGRRSDYIKILGEGVSLIEINSKLHNLLILKKTDPNLACIIAVPDIRKQNKLILIFDQNKIKHYQLGKDFLDDILSDLNSHLRRYEFINDIQIIQKIPRSSLGKIITSEIINLVKGNHNE